MAAPMLSMRRLVVVTASSSVRHALSPAVFTRRRICWAPNGECAPGGAPLLRLPPAEDLERSFVDAPYPKYRSQEGDVVRCQTEPYGS
eukprot:3870555-Pyramimonas_sp.AAC.1